MSDNDRLTVDAIKKGLNTKIIGNHILVFDSVTSTMDIARERIAIGSPEGLTVFAEAQSRGRGRLGRVWTCPKHKGLLFTVILRPEIRHDRMSFLMGMASIATVEAIQYDLDIAAKVRWPNDIIVGEKKVAGVLIEVNGAIGQSPAFSVGIGINVNLRGEELPDQPRFPATSLALEKGRWIDRVRLARTLLQCIDTWYSSLWEGRYELIRERWRGLCSAFDQRLSIRYGDSEYNGRFIDIAPNGDLILELDNNTIRTFRGDHVILSP